MTGPFAAEPVLPHGTAPKTAVVLVNLGTPDEPTPAALRRYLAEFLSDPRVVEIPKALWWLILHGIILRTRPAKSAKKYASIWTEEGSPLAVWTRKQATLLLGSLGERGHRVTVRHAMRYGSPSVASVLDGLKAENHTRVLIVPLYPQYSGATTGSVVDAVAAWALRTRRVPEMRFVGEYHDEAAYIESLAQRVLKHWQEHGRGERLVLSFHGMPERTLHLGDPYHCQCHKTARLLRERLGLPAEQVLLTFQSRFGKAKWLEPYTEQTIVGLARQGVKRIDVMCPGFTSDCLETLEEIKIEVRHAFMAAGGESFHYVECLNDSPAWIRALALLAERHMQGWETRHPPDSRALAQQAEAARSMGSAR